MIQIVYIGLILIVLISADVPVVYQTVSVNKTAGYRQQHLPAVFPPPVSAFSPNISRCVFSGGFSGGAEEEEGSLPPAAFRGLTGLPNPPSSL